MEESENCSLTIDEKIQKAYDLKNYGNEYFKAQNYPSAIRKYHNALMYVKGLTDRASTLKALGAEDAAVGCQRASDQNKQDILELEFLCYNNLAASLLKTQKYVRALDYAVKALDIKPDNTKALFRKGTAEFYLKNYTAAEEVFKKILQLDPTEKSVQRFMKEIEVYKEESLQKQKEMYSKMF